MLHKTKYVLLGVFVTALGLWGLAVTIPNSFSSGEVVSAAKMNQNFQALKDAVDALEAKLAAVQAGQRALPSETGLLAHAIIGNYGNVFQEFPPGTFSVNKTAPGEYEFTVSGIDISNATILLTTRDYPTAGVCNLGTQGATYFYVTCYSIDGTSTKSDRPFRVAIIQ